MDLELRRPVGEREQLVKAVPGVEPVADVALRGQAWQVEHPNGDAEPCERGSSGADVCEPGVVVVAAGDDLLGAGVTDLLGVLVAPAVRAASGRRRGDSE